MFKKVLNKIYCEDIEDFCVRILYFFNTIDTYFIVAGLSTFIIVSSSRCFNPAVLIMSVLLVIFIAKFSDFYPVFIILALPVIIVLGVLLSVNMWEVLLLLLLNVAVFFIIQFGFMGIPDSIVARDPKVAFIKTYNSLFTIAPTTVSFLMSVFYSFFLSYCVFVSVSCVHNILEYGFVFCALVVLFIFAFITRLCRPKNHYSKFLKPDTPVKPIFEKLVILNIDGVRKDVFDQLDLPVFNKLKKEASWHVKGLETVYRALTNPAFASIFTGAIPKIHGVKDNNFGQTIKTEGLPDIVPTIAYGSMHVKHFCKKYWETKIVSLPEHSVYKSDDVMISWLKEDIVSRSDVRLFVADFSEADFLAHAYGSKSDNYKDALRRIDSRIGKFIDWLKTTDGFEKTGIVICSDHGIAAIDHSYLLAESEKYVPFLVYGKGIKKNYEITKPGKIMDICCTVAYLLGIKYPYDCRGQVFLDIIENENVEITEGKLIERFNTLKYEAEACDYSGSHSEIYQGDSQWWEEQIKRLKEIGRPLRVLDIGCGAGFVGEKFIELGVDVELFICMDISDKILEKAKEKLGNYSQFKFVNSLADLQEKFDVITASSIFHHLLKPNKLALIIDGLLADGGVVIGCHEPNINAFKSNIFTLFAKIYKKIGGGISISDEVVEKFNVMLRDRYPYSSKVSKEEILQLVEYHSPVEQYLFDIDKKAGFVPGKFYTELFPQYDILINESYTTCFYRSFFNKHRKVQKILILLFKYFFKEGNLFRFCLRKPIV